MKLKGKGVKCGKGWISSDKNCHGGKSKQVSKQLDTMSELLNNYFSSLSAEDSNIFPQNEGIFANKANALGMQAYFSEKYREINKYFYDSKYKEEAPEEIKMLAEGAKRGFEDMPEYSVQEIQEHYKNKGVEYDGKHTYRGMTFYDVEQLNQFVSAHPEGESIKYPAFTSTSVANPEDSKAKKVNGGWGNKPVQVKIIQKQPSRGKWVDKRKRQKDEGEILYPPEQEFKVVKVETVKEERLPDRLREPLMQLFKPSDEGGGVGSLTLKSVIGEIDPKKLKEYPEYSWLLALMKKRGLPPLDSWSGDTKLSELMSASKMTGGRMGFYQQTVESLRNQVKREERTNSYDIVSARIILEEI